MIATDAINIGRRRLLQGAGSLAMVGLDSRLWALAPASADGKLMRDLAALEQRSGGHLGVAVMDGKTGAMVGHRQNNRFTMCSTFKLSLAAMILARIDAGAIAPDARLLITRADPVGHSPVVRAHLDAGESSMSVIDLAQAAQTQSDNGAANILLRKIGGPAALTAFWRGLGDRVSRLDRYEPGLNTSHGRDLRDTTTPLAMAQTLRAIVAGPLLTPASRARLIDWTVATQTGLGRLRAGLPAGWRAGDKTGTMNGDKALNDKYNDVALCWPTSSRPFFIAAYFESAVKGHDGARPEDDAVLAEVGRIAAGWIMSRA